MIHLLFTDGTSLDIRGKTLASIDLVLGDEKGHPGEARDLSHEDGRSLTLAGKPRKPHRRAPVPGTQRYDVLAWFAAQSRGAHSTAHDCAAALKLDPSVVTGQLSGLCKAGYLARTAKVQGATENTYRTLFAVTERGRAAVASPTISTGEK